MEITEILQSDKWEDVTVMFPDKYKKRFRFFELGHTCGIKIKPENRDRRILCNCSVRMIRLTKFWWKPFYWLGIRLMPDFRKYPRLHWWVRRNLTFN